MIETSAATFAISRELDLVRVNPDGERVAANVGTLRAGLHDVTNEAANTRVVRFAPTSFLDSSGLCVLVEMSNRFANVVLKGPSLTVRRIVDVSEPTTILSMES